MAKKTISVICTLAMLTGLTACGIEKPDLETKAQIESSGSSSASEDKKKIFEIKDSHLTLDLNERLHVDALVSGNSINNVSSYGLKTPDLTEDQIADILMSNCRSEYKETDSGEKIYSNDKENLSIRFVDKTPEARSSSPALIYSLDKGKEYYYVVSNIMFGDPDIDADAEKAVALVKDKLDKLHVEYGALAVSHTDHDQLNSLYGSFIKDQKEQKEHDQAVSDGSMIIDYSPYISSLLYGPLDENFQFTADDDVYIISGNIMFKELPVKTNDVYEFPSIKAAVSSRGIEYLYLDNLYSPEKSFGGSPVIPVEDAVDSFRKAFEAASDKLDITIDSIFLAYLKDYSEDASSSTKYSYVPVWTIGYSGTDGDKAVTYSYCHISASDGQILTAAEKLFVTVD